MDITQQDYDYFISAYQAVKTAGPDKHLPCSPSHDTGFDRDSQRGCVLYIMAGAKGFMSLHHEIFKAAWRDLFGEQITYTNERGYETVCESFDYLISHYAPLFTPDYAPAGEPEPIMGLA